MRFLSAVLRDEFGVTAFADWILTSLGRISPDGTAVSGIGQNPAGRPEAFVARINTRAADFAPGSSYAPFHVGHLGGLDSAFDLKGGVALVAQTVTVDTTSGSADIKAASDVATLGGTGADAVVVQMNYDFETAANLFGGDQSLILGRYDGVNWVNAVADNSPVFVSGPYDGNATPGRYGLDRSNRVAWAVVNSGGAFAVINNPVSSTAASDLIHGVFLLSPPTDITVIAGQAVDLYVSVDADPSSFSSVEFFVDDTSLGGSTALRDHKTWMPTRAGDFRLRAIAKDNQGRQKAPFQPVRVVLPADGSASAPSVTLLPGGAWHDVLPRLNCQNDSLRFRCKRPTVAERKVLC
jgi:hypothetical protein